MIDGKAYVDLDAATLELRENALPQREGRRAQSLYLEELLVRECTKVVHWNAHLWTDLHDRHEPSLLAADLAMESFACQLWQLLHMSFIFNPRYRHLYASNLASQTHVRLDLPKVRHAVGMDEQRALRARRDELLLERAPLGIELIVLLETHLARIVALPRLTEEVLGGEEHETL